MKNIVITIQRDHNNFEAIAESFKTDGLTVTNIFPFGVITGSANDETIEKIKSYSEVISVTDDKEARILK